MSRLEEVAEYLGIEVDPCWDVASAAPALGCDTAYLTSEPGLAPRAVAALARMGEALSDRDATEAQRFAAYLTHARDD